MILNAPCELPDRLPDPGVFRYGPLWVTTCRTYPIGTGHRWEARDRNGVCVGSGEASTEVRLRAGLAAQLDKILDDPCPECVGGCWPSGHLGGVHLTSPTT